MMKEKYREVAEEVSNFFDRKTSYFDQTFEDMEEENKNNQSLSGL